jgi:hypothetical protein
LKDIVMRRLFAVAVAVVLACPALAQSADTSIGSGNVAQEAGEDRESALSAFAYRERQQRNDLAGRTVLPYTLQEHRAFERAKGNIW